MSFHGPEQVLGRYASQAMGVLWSDGYKFVTWRKLWVALAASQHELGLEVTAEQVAELKAHEDTINFTKVNAYEKLLRHDVMAHIKAYGDDAPNACGIIHLGATSCFVGDNTDLIRMRFGLRFIHDKVARVIAVLGEFAFKWKDQAVLGHTHLQAAQPTTLGKRACVWIQDFLMDLEAIQLRLERIPFRGVKGTTGTQASFLHLFHGDHEKVKELDRLVAEKMGFSKVFDITGQTYTRKLDTLIIELLSGVSSSAHKFAEDIRLLMSMREVEEPFEDDQVGSSAMAYKRNPMRCERICSLARYVMSLPTNCQQTHAQQWLERTLDDSANRRIVLPQAFLATDGILDICINVANGLIVWPKVIEKRLMAELPFLSTENILMSCVEAGGDRQELHEAIRVHSMAASQRIKSEGLENDLFDRISSDPKFVAVHGQLHQFMDPKTLVGRAPQQVDEFIRTKVHVALAKLENDIVGISEPTNCL